jgi:crossover junction endodeoxyribonuclease RuvC
LAQLRQLVGISVQQFKEMKQRLGGKARASRPALETAARPSVEKNRVILGVDPSLRGTGYGIIRVAQPHPETLAQGTISCHPAWEHSRCLVRIAEILRDAIREHQPTVCVIEGLYFAQNLQTTLTLGEARGAAMTVIAEAGLEIYELAPRKVKQAIVGHGGAQKLAVAKMVQRMLRLAELPAPDAADALALALTHAQAGGRFSFNTPKKI